MPEDDSDRIEEQYLSWPKRRQQQPATNELVTAADAKAVGDELEVLSNGHLMEHYIEQMD